MASSVHVLRLYLIILDQTFIHYETCLVNPGLIPNTGEKGRKQSNRISSQLDVA